MAILRSSAAINLFMAGIGSGKSHLSGIKCYQIVQMFPDSIGFVGANFYDQLNTATLYRIREFWKSIGVTEYDKDANPHGLYTIGRKPPSHFRTETHNFKSYDNIISFVNGAVVFTGSMDNARAHEGKELNYAFLDETKDTDETDVKEIIVGRLRRKGMYLVDGKLSTTGTLEQQYNPLYITTSPAKTEWIAKWFDLEQYADEINEKIYSRTDFFEKRIGNKFVTISSTYHNIANVGEGYIQNILDNNSEERGRALVYGNPFSVLGGEYYSSFSRLKHVEQLRYDPSKPIHISFDQNTVPYNSASIWQIERREDIWYCYCIDEIALENPRNSTEEVCEEFIRRYPVHKAGLFYYGDASGKNRSTMSKEFKHHYQIVEYKLRKYLSGSADRTAHRNPPVVKRRDFINKIFEEKLPIRIIFDERCKYMIGDMLYCRQAPDGLKDKKIVTNKETGEKYQERGHLSDGMEYFITQAFINYFQA